MIMLTLPFPPSVNGYWRAPTKGRLAGRHLISAKGRQFRQDAIAAIVSQHQGKPLVGRLEVELRLCAPDRRGRDIDNYSKGCLDAITHAGVWLDDGQIDKLTVERGPITKGGQCTVWIREVAA